MKPTSLYSKFVLCLMSGLGQAKAGDPPATIYHVVSYDVWMSSARTNDEYLPPTFQQDGFIHCSTLDQIVSTTNAFHKGEKNLLLLEINSQTLRSPLKYDDSPSWNQLFPHIYGPLNTNAITAIRNFPPKSDGTFSLNPVVYTKHETHSCEHSAVHETAQADLETQCRTLGKHLEDIVTNECSRTGDDGGYVDTYTASAYGFCSE